MVVHEIHIMDAAVFKTENNPPIRPNRHGPKSSPIPFERMQPVTGQVHFAHLIRFIETGEYTLNLVHGIRWKLAALALTIQPFQSTMAKAADHT